MQPIDAHNLVTCLNVSDLDLDYLTEPGVILYVGLGLEKYSDYLTGSGVIL